MELTNKKIIYQGNSIISIENIPEYSHPVVIKKPVKLLSSRRNILSLEKEYEMTRSLNLVEGVRKALELKSTGNELELIMEYIDGETLQNLIERKKINLRSRLEIAIDLARILGKIHQQNIIHLNINSKNILIGKKKQTVHIIDLGAASIIKGNSSQKVRPDQMLGSLPYISPEQTGRINRNVDERSDLYSLGVILYELVTGQLPFDLKDPLKLVHHHITRIPLSPSEVSSGVPEVLSDIILKLLSKNAEDRYQSAGGVQADLEKCLQRLSPEDTIAAFPLGETDFANRLRFPHKLYGRDRELKELESAFESVCRGTSSIVFVAGYSGIGKTALVEEIQRPVSEKGGYYIKGKFDQYLRTTPFTAISQAFTGLISQILTEPEKSFNEWRDKIQSAVGDLGIVLTEVIPNLEEIIGTQPDVPKLEGHEAENRFNYIFINFLSAIANKERPLALFIDDLQWIDAASLGLLMLIRSDFNQSGLIVIGAYRDNEVDRTHPLMEILDNQEQAGLPVRKLTLNNLKPLHAKNLLTDTLKSTDGIHELGTIIFEKSKGNPFFMRRLLSSLNEQRRIHYDSKTNKWLWNISDIQTEVVSDNVADLLAKNLSQLPEETKNILILAACIGNRFDIPTLALISGHKVQKVVKLLTRSSSGQYVHKSGDTFEFVHDQIQQAAYTLIDKNNRIKKHLNIGRLMLANTNDSEQEERIFDIVTHFNLSSNLLTDQEEKLQVVEMNLMAGRKAKISSAFNASTAYLRQGFDLLDENSWQNHYKLTLDVHNELIDACSLNIEYNEVDNLFSTILDKTNQDIDACIAYKTMILTKLARNELAESISIADEILEKLGINFVDTINSKLSVDKLMNLPPIQDKVKAAALEIMMAITSPTYIAATERLPSLAYTMVETINKYGHNHASGPAYNWYSLILCFGQQYKEANHYSRLSINLLQRYPSPGISSQIMDIHLAFIRHWESPVHELIKPLKDYYHVGMQEGNYEWSLWCLLNHTLLIWGTGKPLDFYLSEVEQSIEIIKSKNQEVCMLMSVLFAESAFNLVGQSGQTTQLEGSWFSEEKMMQGLEGNTMLLALYVLQKMTLCYLIGDPREAYQYIEDLLKYRASLNPHYLYTKISFYGGLSCIARLATTESDAESEDLLKNLKLFENDLEIWAKVAPMNYQHQYDLMMAEKCQVENKHWKAVQLYKRAILGAQENHFIHDEALANELFSHFWQKSDNNKIAEIYMREASDLYQQWGANAKVRQIESNYPQWFKTDNIVEGQQDKTGITGHTITQPVTPIQLDMASIISASQMLSAETDLEQLLTKMITLVMANSGAETAVLLLKQDNDWFVQARGDSSSKKYDVLLNQPFDPVDIETDLVPEPVFNYCQRTKEVLVLGDAQLDHRFAEDRMIKNKIRSIACLPALTQGKIRIMLYLENNQMANVFTQENLSIIKHLSTQFGISVENAILYNNLTQAGVKYRTVADYTYDWEYWVNIDGTLKYVSPSCERISGYTAGEFKDNPNLLWEIIVPQDHEKWDKHYHNVHKKIKPREIQFRIKRRDGTICWIEHVCQPVSDNTGLSIGFRASNRDITERKQADEKTRRSEERFRSFVENANEAIMVTQDEAVKYCNQQITELTGYSMEEMRSFGFEKFIHPEDLKVVLDEHQARVSGEKPTSRYSIRIVNKDGQEKYVLVNSTLVDWDDRPATLAMLTDITEIKVAESKLLKSEERFRQLVEDIKDAIYIIDKKGIVDYISPAIKSIIGYEPDEIIGKKFSNFIYPGDMESAKKSFESTLAGKSIPADYRVINKAGSIVWIRSLSNVVKDDKNNILGVRGVISDINKRKQAEQMLQQSERNLEEAQHLAHIGNWWWNIAKNETYWSSELYQILGFSQQNIKPSRYSFLERVHPDDKAVLEKKINKILSNQEPFSIDHRIIRSDGSIRFVHIITRAEYDEENNLTGLYGIVQDITERKKVEEELTKSEEHFRNLMQQSPMTIAIFTPDGQFTDVNPAWYREWGLNREDATEVFARYNHRTDKQLENLGVAPLIERAYAGESVVLPPIEYIGNRALDELGVKDVEARTRWIQIHLYPIKGENGSVASVVNINVDITELKQAEHEAQEQQETLARVSRATRLGQLTGSIAHELNQPLTGILSNSQAGQMLLSRKQLDKDELTEIMTDIVADTKRARDVIHNLRELYREQKVEFHPFELSLLIKDTINLLKSEFVMHQVNYTTDYDSTVPFINGNRIQIQQVIVNIILNGIQIMDKIKRNERKLYINTASDGDELKFCVEDTGPGIPIDKIERIFEPLSSWKPDGTGMGLAISKSIIESHGGKMWAENRTEGGARVGFTIPVFKKSKTA